MRLSRSLRYLAPFAPPAAPFAPDGDTVALYHLDEGAGTVAGDSSGAAGGPSDGVLKVGGSPSGPLWSGETPFGPGGCAVEPYGLGLGGANVALLASTSLPALGQTVTFDVSGLSGGGSGLLALGGAAASFPLLGGTGLVAPTPLVLTPFPYAGGAASLHVPVPTTAGLAGATVRAQAAAPDGTPPAGWALSNGLALTLCP